LAVILDTNGLSAMADGDARLQPLLEQATQIAVPAIVLGEYKFGIRHSRSRRRYERWLSEVVANCRVLPVDEGTAETYAEVRDELKRQGPWIAALVRQHALPLLSRDQHFDFVPKLKRLGW
jgi:predicted nucleic acid-binding protein